MEKLISKTSWKIIELLGERDRTPTELVNLLKISHSSLHKHLENLERNNFIIKIAENKGKTRPYKTYSLGEGFIYFIEALNGEVAKKFLRIDENLKVHLNVWKIPQKEFQYFVERFWWDIQDDMEKINSIGVFGSVAKGNAREDSDIDILILTNKKENLLEKKYGTKIIKKPYEKGKMIMSQIFEKNGFIEAIIKKSKFANEAIKNMILIYDKEDFLLKIKRQYGT